MATVRLVMEEDVAPTVVMSATRSPIVWSSIGASALLLATIGMWLMWLSAFIHLSHQEEEIRAACLRAMLDRAERCFDTVVIQRGGGRR